ncbi:hypothetical protein AO265_36850 [Pseudomonas sp. ABAC61]|nr:hypothetical protein AO265_36850 [Pseudomonas sp. ABAC61]
MFLQALAKARQMLPIFYKGMPEPADNLRWTMVSPSGDLDHRSAAKCLIALGQQLLSARSGGCEAGRALAFLD